MARGAQKKAEDLSSTGVTSSQQFNTQLEGQNAAIQNYLTPQYKNMIQNPGYDAATKAAITQAGQGATAASFGGASDAIDRSAARTNNSAGLVAGQEKLAMDKGRTMADVASKDQIQFADAARSDVQSGLKGLSGLYGTDQTLLARSLGVPVEYLSNYINAGQMKKGGFTGAFSTALGAGLGGGLSGQVFPSGAGG